MSRSEHFPDFKDLREVHRGGDEHACLWRVCTLKGHSYRDNGRSFIATRHRVVYNLEFSVPGPDQQRFHDVTGGRYKRDRDPSKAAQLWWIGAGPRGGVNFHSQNWPFPHQFHHILPFEAIVDNFEGNERLTHLLLHARYNINRGVNVIILPREERESRIVRLPVHCGSHPQYSTHVASVVERIRKQFGKGADPQGEHPTEQQIRQVATDLETWSAREFLAIAAWGRRYPGKRVNEKPAESFAAPPAG